MISIKASHLRHITRRFWTFLLGSIIAFAVLVQIGRQAFLLVDDYSEVLAESLSDQLGVDVRIGEVKANWRGLRLELQLSDIDIYSERGVEIFTVGAAEAELSLIDSAIERGFAWRVITFQNLTATFVQKKDSGWKIKGYDGGTANTDNPFIFDDPLDIFLFGRRVDIVSAIFLFEFRNGTTTELAIPSISLENDRFFHRMNVGIDVDGARALTFVVEGYGDPRNREKFSASGYLGLQSAPIGEVASAFLNDASSELILPYLDASELDLEVWFRGSPHSGMTASGTLTVDGIDGADKDFNVPQEIRSDLSGVWNSNFGWQFMLRQPELLWEEESIEFSDIGLFGRAGRQGLRVNELRLEDLVTVVMSSSEVADDTLSDILGQLNPRGMLSNLEIQLKPKDEGYFLARANLSAGAIDPIYGIPDLDNVSAYVEASLLEGYADIDIGEGTTIHLPKVFEETFNLDTLKGQLSWRIDVENKLAFLESSELVGTQGEKNLKSVFAMELPFNRSVGERELSMIFDVDAADILEYATYLPKNTPEELTDWLAGAVRGGTAQNIQILYRGSVQSDPQFKPTYQVAAGFSELDFRFNSKWPTIKNATGLFLLDSNQVAGTITSGEALKNNITRASFETRDYGDGQGVHVYAEFKGRSADAKAYVLKSPLKEVTDDFLPSWKLSGQYRATMQVDMPFKGNDIQYHVETTLRDNTIDMSRLDLQLTHIDGMLHFSKNNGLRSDKLDFKLWNKNFVASINSDNTHQDIHIDLDGELNTKRLQEWAARPELIFLSGDTRVQGELKIPTSGESTLSGVALELESNLEGMGIDLPAPFYKTPDKPLADNVKLQVDLVDGGINYHYSHGDVFNLSTVVTENALPIIDMRIGSVEAGQIMDTVVSSAGNVKITGVLERADYEVWSKALDRYVAASSKIEASSEQAQAVKILTNLKVGSFTFFDQTIPDIKILASNGEDQSWNISADSGLVLGNITIPPSEQAPISLHLQRLSLAAAELDAENELLDISDQDGGDNGEGGPIKETSRVSDINLNDLGRFDVRIDQLNIGNEDWGNWAFKTYPIENGLVFEELKAEVRKLNIGLDKPSRFTWTKENEQHRSYFVGSISTNNIGKALTAWGFEKLMESKKAEFDVDVAWNAEPDLIALYALQGDVAFNIENGSFLRADAAGENPLLRLMALFNFDTFARRLRLDFSDLAAKGFAFDQVNSELRFEQGTALIQKPLIVESSSSKMQMVGELDLVNENIEAELVVTLPVAGNLAVAAAFAAGLPAGLGVYIISKMFDKQVDKASSISYSVDGSWSDPKLKVRKVFENKAKARKKSKVNEADEPSTSAQENTITEFENPVEAVTELEQTTELE